MRRKLVAFLGAALVAAVLAGPALAEHVKPGHRSGSTIIALRG
jgi:hypothetical protein